MTKRSIAALLAALMLIMALVSCKGNEDNKPPVGTQGGTQGGAETTKQPEETEPPAPETYVPDPECKNSGKVGFGVSAGSAMFDDFEVINNGKQASINYLIERATFEEGVAVPTFTALGSTEEVTPTVVADPTDKKGANHAIDLSSGTMVAGETNWNLYRYTVKVLPKDETGDVIDIYFCIVDENNYYVLTLGEEENTKANVYKVTDGKKENAQFAYPCVLDTKKLTMIGITLEKEIITVNIAGKKAFSINDPTFINDYCEYDGDENPGSIEMGKLGAPDVNLEWVRVAEENILHDGKGTWNANTANIASKVFDNDNTTFYDCDADEGYGNKDGTGADVDFGIPGDGSFLTGYVGAKLDAATTIRYIRYAMRKDNPARSAGCFIEASVDGVTWVKIADVTDTSTANEYHTIKITDETPYQYVRFVATNDKTSDSRYCNVAELEIWVDKN